MSDIWNDLEARMRRTNRYAGAGMPTPMKDHEIAQLVNKLRDIANEYAGTEQLRGRISECVTAALKA